MTTVEAAQPHGLPEGMTLYHLGLLKRGPIWTPDETPEVERLQAAHLAYIEQMAASGKLVAAGPFTDGGHLRGMFLFRAATLEEAMALAEADPAVQAGRLLVEIHPWMVPSGALP